MSLAGLSKKRIVVLSPCAQRYVYRQITKPMLACISIFGRKKKQPSGTTLLRIEALPCCILYIVSYHVHTQT